VFLVGLRDRSPVVDLQHLINSAAWGIHFETKFSIRGAGIKAEAAVDAAGEILLTGRIDDRTLRSVHTTAPD
jgi:hypothetical protein